VKLADLDDHLAHASISSGAPPYAWARRRLLTGRDLGAQPAPSSDAKTTASGRAPWNGPGPAVADGQVEREPVRLCVTTEQAEAADVGGVGGDDASATGLGITSRRGAPLSLTPDAIASRRAPI
jgi:hypothetical protein